MVFILSQKGFDPQHSILLPLDAHAQSEEELSLAEEHHELVLELVVQVPPHETSARLPYHVRSMDCSTKELSRLYVMLRILVQLVEVDGQLDDFEPGYLALFRFQRRLVALSPSELQLYGIVYLLHLLIADLLPGIHSLLLVAQALVCLGQHQLHRLEAAYYIDLLLPALI